MYLDAEIVEELATNHRKITNLETSPSGPGTNVLHAAIGALIEAYQLALARKGMAVLPIEPTPQMLRRGDAQLGRSDDCAQLWRAMASAFVADYDQM